MKETQRTTFFDDGHRRIMTIDYDHDLVSDVVEVAGTSQRTLKRFEGETAWSDAWRLAWDESLERKLRA